MAECRRNLHLTVLGVSQVLSSFLQAAGVETQNLDSIASTPIGIPAVISIFSLGLSLEFEVVGTKDTGRILGQAQDRLVSVRNLIKEYNNEVSKLDNPSRFKVQEDL